jgi:hypothetical protein
MTPNIDRNEAPETWITAAPLDTLTIKDKFGRPVTDPTKPAEPTTIPVRFHLYWAGSDKDGAVSGFYYAVVETTTDQTEGVQPLPGPKPGQYSFTTKTDTTFVFTVSELFPDRQHVFFIYAVDNQGKPDPTPARFMFNANDKFPPRPIIGPQDAWATGRTVTLTFTGEPDPMPVVPRYITDTLAANTLPTDTVPAYSRLDFRWHGEITQPGTSIAGYRYKLDETQLQEADAATTTVSYGTGLPGSADVAPGLKIFTLKALDQSGGAGTTRRRFIMNYVPDTWWAGPDPSLFPVSTDLEYNSHSLDVTSWPSGVGTSFTFANGALLPAGSSFGPDSLAYRPSKRSPQNWGARGTFYEIYKDRLYARSEGDTVHMNSFVVLWNGGYDKDSRYIPRVTTDTAGPTDPRLRHSNNDVVTGAVVEAAGLVGSPIGFRSLIVNRLTPLGLRSIPAQTSIYPVYEPASVYRAARIGGYWRMFQAGKAYAVARAEDADGGLDNSVKEPVSLADAVDEGGGTPADRLVRNEVLVFYVDKAPALVKTGFPQFLPTEGQSISSPQWDFRLRGMDLDPYDPGDPSPPKGGPTSTTVIRFKITLYGHSVVNPDSAISWTYYPRPGVPYILEGTDVELSFIPGGSMAANPFASGPIRVSIQICDCVDCEGAPGQGRCVDGIDPLTGEVPDRPGYTSQNVITVNYTRPSLAQELGTTSATGGRPGPDLSGRRD